VRQRRKETGTILIGLLLAAGMPAAAADAPPVKADPKAAAIADQVMDALGGKKAWDDTHYLRFDFGVEKDGKFQGRSHTWDKWTGRYRLEGKTPEGKSYVTLMNVNTKEGETWMDGKKLEGDDAKKALERAYGAWINDTYWLLVPYKLKDPGVVLAYGGEEKGPGGMRDKLVLTFDNVGLTPKDKYWIYVNRDNHLVDRWDYVLKGEKVPPTTWEWKGWSKHGNMMYSSERVNPKEGRKLMMPVFDVTNVPDAVFTSPQAAPQG